MSLNGESPPAALAAIITINKAIRRGLIEGEFGYSRSVEIAGIPGALACLPDPVDLQEISPMVSDELQPIRADGDVD